MDVVVSVCSLGSWTGENDGDEPKVVEMVGSGIGWISVKSDFVFS